jgi:tetratricopeptide (TPR) repeat protein
MGGFLVTITCFHRAAVSQPIPPTPRELQLDSLFSAGAFQQVVDVASQYLAEAEVANDSVMMGRMLTAMGRGGVMLGRPDGLSTLERSIAVSRAVRDTTNWMSALGYQSLVLSFQGRYDESHELNLLRLELARLSRDKASEAWARTMLGYIALLRGDLETARGEYTQAVDFFFQMDLRREALTPLVGLGRVYNSLHDVDNARECYQRVMETARVVGDRVNEAHAVNNLGTLEYEYGDMELAVQYYQRSREMAAQSGNVRGTITPSSNIALAMQYLGRYQEADSTLSRMLHLCESEGFNEFVPMILTGLAQNRFLQRRYNASVKVYRRLLDMADALPKKQYDEAVFGLSRSLTMLGNPQEALDIIEKSYGSAPEPELPVFIYWSKANCLLELDRPEEALENALAAEKREASYGSGLVVVPFALQLSRCYRRLGRVDDAIAWFEEAVERHSRRQRSRTDYAWRESLGGVEVLVDESGVILERPGKPRREREAELFDLFQRFKVRTLIDRITEPRKLDEPLSQLAEIRLVDLRTVQNDVLEPDEVFLDFAVGYRTGYLFAITRDSCRVVRIPGEYSTFAKRVAVYRQFTGRRPQGSAGATANFEGMNASMGEAILGGVADLVRTSTTVIVSPASLYGGVPFGALALPDADGRSRSLLSSKLIQQVPSATILAWLRSREAVAAAGPSASAVLAVAPVGEYALAGARREVESIQRTYAGVSRTRGASSRTIAKSAGPYEVIHVAAHIEVNDEKPWHSGIFVGAANAGDEFQADPYLRAGDIASRRMPARLAVLSGCESAMGRSTVGEGVAGLTAAFLSAGVQSVVATLWRVDDSVTADLMARFYRRLADGVAVADALRAAQIETQSHVKTRHPFYWAGFVVVGDGGMVVGLEKQPWRTPNSLLLVLLGIVLASAVVGILFRFRKL